MEDKLGGSRQYERRGTCCGSILGTQGEIIRAEWHSEWKEVLDVQLDVESVGFGDRKKKSIGFKNWNGGYTKIQDRENRDKNKLRSKWVIWGPIEF